MNDAIELIQAIAWPVVVLVALIVLRRPLSDFIRDLGRRVTKLSVFQVSIDLATVSEFDPTWRALNLGDIRQPTAASLFDLPAQNLLEKFIDTNGFDYALVDLGGGDEWLSSRLFVFAEILPRLRGLHCFVFVEETEATSRRLVGMARPEAVRWTLAQRYPWLDSALEQAYADTAPPVISPAGAVDSNSAQQIGQAFLSNIQMPAGKPGQASQPPPPSPDHDPGQPVVGCRPGWVPVQKVPGQQEQDLCEHGEWLDGPRVRHLLGTSLQEDAWVKDDPDASEEEQVRAVLRRKGDFVAIVSEDRAFRSLVDRHLLLEECVARQLRQRFD
jgi:hypothetical protein